VCHRNSVLGNMAGSFRHFSKAFFKFKQQILFNNVVAINGDNLLQFLKKFFKFNNKFRLHMYL